ncbi:MAG: cytosine permease [Candidatus Magasanikbacteria bacterium]
MSKSTNTSRPDSKKSELLEDYADRPVPDSETKDWFNIGVVFVGSIIAIPILLLGFVLGHKLTLSGLIISTLAGTAIVTLITIPTSMVGAKTRLSTYMISKFTFGKSGAKVVALVIAVTMFGWVGINLGVFGFSLQEILSNTFSISINQSLIIGFSGLLMILTAIFGFKGLHKLSLFSVPLLGILLILSLYKAFGQGGVISSLMSGGSLSTGAAISMVVGSVIAASVYKPDLTRYAETPKQGAGAAAFGHLLMLPILLIISAIAAAPTGAEEFNKVMYSLGLGTFGFIVLFLASWSTNDNNLYVSSLGLNTIFPLKKWQITVIVGIAGTLLAIWGILDQFQSWLLLLSVAIPPIASVYLADFYLFNREFYKFENIDKISNLRIFPFISWFIGSIGGYMTMPVKSNGLGLFKLTTISTLDAMLISLVVYVIGYKLFIEDRLREDQ